MKKIKIFLLLTLAFLLVGCSNNPNNNNENTNANNNENYEISIYYPTKKYVETGSDSPKMKIDNTYSINSSELIETLRKNPDNNDLLQGIADNIIINNIEIKDNIAFVDFSSENLNGSSLEEEILINQLVLSLNSMKKDNNNIINGVTFTINGKKAPSLMGHYDTSQILNSEI